MTITYGPDETPEYDPRAGDIAARQGLIAVAIVVDEPDAQVGNETGATIGAYVQAVPRIGEILCLQDGGEFVVRHVRHKLFVLPGTKLITAMPNLYAVRK